MHVSFIREFCIRDFSVSLPQPKIACLTHCSTVASFQYVSFTKYTAQYTLFLLFFITTWDFSLLFPVPLH